VLEAQYVTAPGLTGERQHFSSDCDVNKFALTSDASVDLEGLGWFWERCGLGTSPMV